MTKTEKMKLQEVKNFLDYMSLVSEVACSVAVTVAQAAFHARRVNQCKLYSDKLASVIKGERVAK